MSNTLLESLWARVDANIGARITQISGLLTQALSANAESIAARDDAVVAEGNAASSASNASSSESRASISASNAASSEAAAKSAESSSFSHAQDAQDFATSSLAAAERAELAAEETIQQVEGDFATRNYVDQKVASVPLTGTGLPEGNVAAPVGASYIDTAATNGAIRWIKASGTGNTGWRVEYGDTGWLRLDPLGEYFTGDGGILFRRIGNRAMIKFESVGVDTQGNSSIYLSEPSYIPVGFRPEYADRPSFWVSNLNANPNYLITIAQGSRIRYQTTSVAGSHPGTGNLAMRGEGSWVTDQPWPTSLPGSPV